MADKMAVLKPKLVYGFCLVVVFGAGWGIGRGVSQKIDASSTPQPTNYTTKATGTNKPAPAETETETADTAGATIEKSVTQTKLTNPPANVGTKPDPNQPCIVKGNVSSSSKIYHIKGGAFYDRVTPEQCFATPAEAESAGFRKSKK